MGVTYDKDQLPLSGRRRVKGKVRLAAIDAALAAVERDGAPVFTLREIAETIGVVHSALYRHFPSRADLLAAVAEQGFRDLLQELRGADAVPAWSASDRLKRLCRIHLDFALRNGPRYKVMFGPDVAPFDVEGTSFQEAASKVLEVAVGAVADCQTSEEIGGEDPLLGGLVFWSSLHGLAMLAIDGRLGPKLNEERNVHALLEVSVEALLKGLAAPATWHAAGREPEMTTKASLPD